MGTVPQMSVAPAAGVGGGPGPGVPSPVLPDYTGACLTSVVPTLLAALAGEAGLPVWAPSPLAGARQVVLLVLDGLGWEQLRDFAAEAPTLAAAPGGPITSVAPTTTATALTSLTTGVPPATHGILGYRLRVDLDGDLVADGDGAGRAGPGRC